MTFLLIVLALSVVGVVSTVRQLPRDGYRAVPTDPTRVP